MLLPHIAYADPAAGRSVQGFPHAEHETVNHYHQFVEAVMGNGKTTTSFDYSGPLTEAVLLGPLSTRSPRPR